MPSAAAPTNAFEANVTVEGKSAEPTTLGSGAGVPPPPTFVTELVGLRRPLARMSSTAPLTQPEVFDPVEIRRRNREITRRELLPKRREIARKRAALLRRKLDGELSPREVNTLRYLEWQLDRIEDAEIGEQLDTLQAITDAHEILSRNVETWLSEIRKVMPRPSKHKSRAKRKR